jgi:UDP-N-acetylglucosamine 2-epimerase
MPVRLASIVGARPQFIKCFPIARMVETLNRQGGPVIEHILIHSGQHYDYEMSKIFFDELEIPEPVHHLGVGSGSHAVQTAHLLTKIEEVLTREHFDCVLVYGDTNTTLGAALTAAKMQIPIAHVEAGLRSYNTAMPEEINRVLTDRVSSFLFCPSIHAARILEREGFRNILLGGELCRPAAWPEVRKTLPRRDVNISLVVNCGDIMYEVLQQSLRIAQEKSNIIKQLNLEGKDYYLLTLHRAETTDSSDRWAEIVSFINETTKGKPVIFPMHPRTRHMYESAKKKFSENVRVIDPAGYFDNLFLLQHSATLLTDSGGMQKEAYWLKIPCITLRDETEWVETVEDGWNVLYKDHTDSLPVQKQQKSHYGDGTTSELIVTMLRDIFSG